jgi:hypothetical protein
MNHQDDDPKMGIAIKAQATRHKTPPALHSRILVALNQADQLHTAPIRKPFWASFQRHWLEMGVAFACGVIVSLAVNLFHAAPEDEDQLSQEVGFFATGARSG